MFCSRELPPVSRMCPTSRWRRNRLTAIGSESPVVQWRCRRLPWFRFEGGRGSGCGGSLAGRQSRGVALIPCAFAGRSPPATSRRQTVPLALPLEKIAWRRCRWARPSPAGCLPASLVGAVVVSFCRADIAGAGNWQELALTFPRTHGGGLPRRAGLAPCELPRVLFAVTAGWRYVSFSP